MATSISTSSSSTALAEFAKHTSVSIDCNDAAAPERYPALGKRFLDMTSNQAIVAGELKKPEHATLIARAKELGGADRQLVADYATVLLGVALIPQLHLTGRVHAQTAPSLADDAAATVQHARRLVNIYGELGIPPDRVCIKIPASPAGLAACAELESVHRIATLATVIVCVEQAIAAARAGCRYIAPYVNPLRVHFTPGAHVVYGDPLQQLSGAKVALDSQRAYAALGVERTQVMVASLVTVEEVVSLTGVAHATLAPGVLEKLATTPLDGRLTSLRDQALRYLATPMSRTEAEGYDSVEVALSRDPAKHDFEEAIRIFTEFETQLLSL